MSQSPLVSQVLEQLHIPHRVFSHAGPVKSLEQAAAERGQDPSQIVRSLLFRLGEAEFVMVLVAGPSQVPWKALRKHLQQSRLTTATPEEVLQITGYQIGAVSPFGLPQALPILVDTSVTQADEVSIGSGVRGTTVILRSADLQSALSQLPGPVSYVNLL